MQKQDNKSTLTGLVLIGIIFVAYSIFFPFTPEETASSEELNTTEDVPVEKKENDIEIDEHIDYISLTIIDSGIGFENIKTSELTKPYFTTKADGTGLGLSIVNKIINDHNGVIKFTNLSDGAKIEIKFYK